MTYRSDKADGPTAGAEKLDALEFLARLVTHIPDKHQVMTRYYGWYANRPRGERKQLAAEVSEPAPIPVAEREDRRDQASIVRPNRAPANLAAAERARVFP